MSYSCEQVAGNGEERAPHGGGHPMTNPNEAEQAGAVQFVKHLAEACKDKGVAHVKVNGLIYGGSPYEVELTMSPAALIPPHMLDGNPEEDERDHTYDATGSHPVDLRKLRDEQGRE